MNHKKNESSNLRLAVIFITVVVFFILFSVVLKFAFLVKESKFDGSNKFNVQIIDPQKTEIISFSPSENSISILKIGRRINGDLSRNLEVPIDGIIVYDKNFNDSKITSSLLSGMFFGNKIYKMTSFDLAQLTLFSRRVQKSSIYVRNFTNDYSPTQKFNILYLTFKDPLIFTENQSIEIINATDEFGLGNRLATFISAIGGNVIFVKGDEIQEKSKITYNNKETYTVKRIKSAINFPAIKTKEQGVADVIIVIGKDALKNINF